MAYLRSSVAALVQVAVVADAQEKVSIGLDVASTGLNEKRPAVCSAVATAGSGAKSVCVSEKPWAPRPPKAPNGTV
ncbi:hypothetical protein ABIA96_001822 [Bradyrhizobium sp. LB11.1]